MKVSILFLSLFLVCLNFAQAQTASELAAQLAMDFETKHGITLTDYQRQSIKSNYYSAITKMERIQHLQATNSMLYEQQRQKIVADAELQNSRLLTGAQMRQINGARSTSVVWPGKEDNSTTDVEEDVLPEGKVEEDVVEDDVVEDDVVEDDVVEDDVVEDDVVDDEGTDDDWEDDDWDDGMDSDDENGEGDVLDKAVNKVLKVDNTAAADSSKGKKVLKKGLKFLYDELLRPAIDKKVEEDGKKEDDG